MPAIEVTRLARDELRELIETRQLPDDTRERVSRSLLTLEEFPRAGKQLSGVWRDCRALIGPWGWLIVVERNWVQLGPTRTAEKAKNQPSQPAPPTS